MCGKLVGLEKSLVYCTPVPTEDAPYRLNVIGDWPLIAYVAVVEAVGTGQTVKIETKPYKRCLTIA